MTLIFVITDDIAKWLQIAAWVAGIFVAIFSVTKIRYEMRENRGQRELELKWKRAAAAKELFDELFDSQRAKSALKMLDWDGSSFEISDGVYETISRKEMQKALRCEDADFDAKEEFVRDSFDGLFYHLGILEHYVARDLVEFEDIKHPIDYYVNLMARDHSVYGDFLKAYGFYRTERFMARFGEWANVRELTGREPVKVLTAD